MPSPLGSDVSRSSSSFPFGISVVSVIYLLGIKQDQMAFNELAVAHGSLRKVPELSCSAIAVSNPKLCIVAAGASGVQTATGLGINEEALLSPAPLLAACAVAVRELDQCPVGSSST